MYDKQIRSLARQIAKLKEQTGSPRYPQEIWDQITALRPHFTLAELSQRLGISPGNLHRRVYLPKSKKFALRKTSLSKKIPSDTPISTLIPISTMNTNSGTPLFEMELPSGAKIKIFA